MSRKFRLKAVYLGRRMNHAGQVCHLFERIDTREPMRFRGISNVWIGCVYECSASQIARRPKRVEHDEDFADKKSWLAQDALVEVALRERRAEAKVKRRSKRELQQLVEAIRPFTRNLLSFEQKAFVNHIVELARKK